MVARTDAENERTKKVGRALRTVAPIAAVVAGIAISNQGHEHLDPLLTQAGGHLGQHIGGDINTLLPHGHHIGSHDSYQFGAFVGHHVAGQIDDSLKEHAESFTRDGMNGLADRVDGGRSGSRRGRRR